jgi:hypothetical protein
VAGVGWAFNVKGGFCVSSERFGVVQLLRLGTAALLRRAFTLVTGPPEYRVKPVSHRTNS